MRKAFSNFILLVFVLLAFTLNAQAQSDNISIDVSGKKIVNVLNEISDKSGVMFSYESVVDEIPLMVSGKKSGSLKVVLDWLFTDTGIEWKEISSRRVVLTVNKRKEAKEIEVKANTFQVKARVCSLDGQPLVGAAVVGYQNSATITDLDGNFVLDVEPDSSLEVSFMGYITAIVKASEVNGKTIYLKEDLFMLEELVMIGYGTKKKESLTGSISSINNKELVTTVHSSLSESLAGKVSGFRVRQNSGEPGSYDSSINIRGFGSPLYVIDGVPSDLGASEFQRINPADIESISVIKDASAAIFGLRAANGVVLVKTKRGSSGAAKVNYSQTFGLESPTDLPQMCSRGQWATLRNEANINAGAAPYFTHEQLQQQWDGISTNWQEEVLKDYSTQQQYSISVSGGNDVASYFASFGYVDENGLLKTEDIDYNKYTLRTNLTANLAEGLSLDVNISGMYDEKDSPYFSFYDIYYAAVTCLPDSVPYVNGDKDYPMWQSFLNPVVIADADRTGYQKTNNKHFSTNLSLTYDVPFLKGLQAKIMGSYQSYYTGTKSVAKEYKLYTYDSDSDTYSSVKKNSPSTIGNYLNNLDMLTLQAQMSYSNSFGKHNVSGLIAYEQHQSFGRVSGLSREYSFFTKDQVDMASLNNMKNNGMESQTASLSLIGRFNYDYASKYLAELAFRNDASYRYAPGYRSGFFPVFSAAWRIAKEDWMQQYSSWLNELKIRASIGLVGEDAGDPFQFISAYSLAGGAGYEFIDGVWTDGASSPSIVNEKLSWYTSCTKDLGITAELFANRLSFEFDVYQRDRNGLLSTRLTTLPNTFGASLPQENLNSDRVRGFDLTLGWRSHIGDFHYSISGTLNYSRTMNQYIEEASALNSYNYWKSGTAYRYNDVVWAYDMIGQFQTQEEINTAPIQGGSNGNTKLKPGDYRYRDVNDDGIINDLDMLPLFFNGTPKLYYGINLSFDWKNIDANVVFQGAGCYTVRYSGVYAEVLAYDLNTPAYFYDRWHQVDPYNPDSEWVAGKWPATRLVTDAGSNYYESSVWRRDASYLRLKSLEIGYTFKNFLRVFFAGHNLLTICDPFVKMFDPEKAEGLNNMGFTYPLAKSYNLGVNLFF